MTHKNPKLSTSRIATEDGKPVHGTKIDGNNSLNVALKGPASAFGDIRAIDPSPVVNLDSIYGIREKTDVEVFSFSTGTVTADDQGLGRQFKCETGTNSFGYGLVRSKRAVRYRPGLGVDLRFTARFSTGVTLSAQRAGGINLGTELSFGYNGSTFGILHRRGGRGEIQKATITTGANGSETATITLNGTAFTVSLTSSGITSTAFQLSQFSFTGYTVRSVNDEVQWMAQAVGAQTGEFSITTTGTLVASISQVLSGQAVTDNFISQSAWNVQTLLDSEDSTFTLDPTKGNVFNIKYQYLGYGAITYKVENPETGLFEEVHKIQYANNNEEPSMDFPIYKVGIFAANLGNTTELSAYMASAAAQIEGKVNGFRNPESHSFSQSAIGTNYTNVLTIRNTHIFNERYNHQEIIPLLAAIAVDGTKPAEVTLFLNPEFSGEPNYTYHDYGNTIAEIMTTKVTITQGSNTRELTGLALGKTGNDKINLKDLDIIVSNGDVLCLAVKASSGTTDATGSLTWRED